METTAASKAPWCLLTFPGTSSSSSPPLNQREAGRLQSLLLQLCPHIPLGAIRIYPSLLLQAPKASVALAASTSPTASAHNPPGSSSGSCPYRDGGLLPNAKSRGSLPGLPHCIPPAVAPASLPAAPPTASRFSPRSSDPSQAPPSPGAFYLYLCFY